MDLFDFLQPTESKVIKVSNNFEEYYKLYKSRNAYVHENKDNNKLDITYIFNNQIKYYDFLTQLDNMIGLKDEIPEFIP